MTAGDRRAVSTVHGPKHNSHVTTKRGLPPATSSDFGELRLRRAQTSASSVEPSSRRAVGSRAQPSRCLGSLVACVATVTAIVLSQPAQAITIRVPQDYAKIQDALLRATHGDVIVVSPGVYVENINFLGKNVVLRGTNPVSSAVVAATIIDGNRKGPVVTFRGSETSSCSLSGFTIRDGLGSSSGGGVSGWGTKARIEHNVIVGNSAFAFGDYGGGGLCGCNGTIQNNLITSNSAIFGAGGGLYACFGTIQNNVITSNSARFGGGLSVCLGTIQNNVITNNSTGGGLEYDACGGGLFDCDGTIQNNVITNNSAGGYGGGLYLCNGTIQNNVISNNSTRGVGGGGGGLGGCNGTIQNNMITSNSAGGYGGGYGGGLFGCDGMIQNNVISNNSASDYPGCGGGLDLCHGTIRNNTICGNSAQHVGGATYHCPAVIVNCIIWGNTAPQDSQMSDSSIPSYSCIQGYTAGQGQGNIGSNPRFRSLTDFRLQLGSPCIDAGTNQNYPATDIDGNRRPVDGNGDGGAVCDMGAYEYGRFVTTAVHPARWMLYK